MKYKIIVVILCIVFMISIAGNIVVNAISNVQKVDTQKETVDTEALSVKIGDKFTRKKIDKLRKIEFGKENDTATYVNSVKYGKDRAYDYYTSDECRYTFDRNGELIGCLDGSALNNPEIRKGKNETVSESQAVAVAETLIQDELSGMADKFELTSTYYNESMKTYYLEFSKMYNSFITGEKLNVRVSAVGELVSWLFYAYGEYDDFETGRLDDVTEKDVEAYADEQARKIYGDNLTKCKVKETQLIKSNDEYVIRISTEIEWNDENGEQFAELKLMYYEI